MRGGSDLLGFLSSPTPRSGTMDRIVRDRTYARYRELHADPSGMNWHTGRAWLTLLAITLRRKSRLNPFGINRPWKYDFHLYGWAEGPWELKMRWQAPQPAPTALTSAEDAGDSLLGFCLHTRIASFARNGTSTTSSIVWGMGRQHRRPYLSPALRPGFWG